MYLISYTVHYANNMFTYFLIALLAFPFERIRLNPRRSVGEERDKWNGMNCTVLPH
jgi:hypothetical protein